jgi:hypothetical protein
VDYEERYKVETDTCHIEYPCYIWGKATPPGGGYYVGQYRPIAEQPASTHPPHYSRLSIEPIDVIEDWKLPFHLGNVVKYIARHQDKGGKKDLEKAKWYLERYMDNYEDKVVV